MEDVVNFFPDTAIECLYRVQWILPKLMPNQIKKFQIPKSKARIIAIKVIEKQKSK